MGNLFGQKEKKKMKKVLQTLLLLEIISWRRRDFLPFHFFLCPPSLFEITKRGSIPEGLYCTLTKNWKLVELFFSVSNFKSNMVGHHPVVENIEFFKSKWCFGGKVRYTIKVKFSLEKSLQGTLGCCSAELYVPLNSTLKIIKT